MQLVACLIEEMVEQCSLLRGGSLQVTPKPFQLSASRCEWSKLQMALKQKDHPWKDLPGGASDALARVKKRPNTFANLLNPTQSKDWTFNNTVREQSGHGTECTLTKLINSRLFFRLY